MPMRAANGSGMGHSAPSISSNSMVYPMKEEIR
jgi:hypothetical protein